MGPDPGPDGPVYALMTQVYSVDDRTVYIALTDSLDVGSIDLMQASEFPGVANIAAVGGDLMVSSGQAPEITKYRVTSDYRLAEIDKISFASYGLPEDGANFFGQWLVNDHTAYLAFDVTSRVVWDPTTFEITGVYEDSRLEIMSGALTLEAAGNRNETRYEGSVLRPFFYRDEDWFEFRPTSQIAIYDRVTHAETSVLEVPCAGAAIASRDEAGNTYFSSWDYGPVKALYGDGPAPCVLKLTPSNTLDASWTNDFTAWTGGRYSMNFRYLSNGKALASVLNHEELGVDFTGPYDPDVGDAIWNTGHWKLWLFDLNSQTAQPVTGINVSAGSSFQIAVLEGRSFVFLPYDDYGRSKVYELDAAGHATERLDVAGDVFKWIRVR